MGIFGNLFFNFTNFRNLYILHIRKKDFILEEFIKFCSVSYYLSYKSIMRSEKDCAKMHGDKWSIYLFPAITIGILACEVALKLKYYQETKKFFKDHDLIKLFKKLSKNSQEEIINNTLDNYNYLMRSLNSNTRIDEKGFSYKLNKIRNGFVDTRYLYEGNFPECDVYFIEALACSLNDECYY